MKLIGDVLILQKKDLKLSEAQIQTKVSHLPDNHVGTLIYPAQHKFMTQIWAVQRALRNKCKNHMTCVGYTGNSKTIKL